MKLSILCAVSLGLLTCTSCAAQAPTLAPSTPTDAPAAQAAPTNPGTPAIAPPAADPTTSQPSAATPPTLGNSSGTPTTAQPPTTDTAGTPTTTAPDTPAAGTPTPTTPVPAAVPPIPITFAAGKHWVYAYNYGDTPSGASTLEIAIQAVTGNNVTWEVSRQTGQNPKATQTVTYPEDGLTPFSFMGVATGSPGEKVDTTPDNVTVPAGTFNATKTTVTDVFDGPSARVTTTIERWITKDVGLIKQTTTSTTAAPSNPAAAGSVAPTVSKIELSLQSFQ